MLANQDGLHMLGQCSCQLFEHSVALLLETNKLQLSRLCELGFLDFGPLFAELCLQVLILDANVLLELKLEWVDQVLLLVLQLETKFGA